MDRVLQRLTRPINKLCFFLTKKVGPRRRAARIQIEIPAVFAAFLRRRYNIGGRWEPRFGAEHECFMEEADIRRRCIRYYRRLGTSYRIAVIRFKLHSTGELRYENAPDQPALMHARVTWLTAEFTCVQVAPAAAPPEQAEERRAA